MTRKRYFVYILLCADGSLYTGYTDDPAGRFAKHRRGDGARYTRMHRPVRIVYLQGFAARSAAMRREHEIKTLTRRQKLALAAGYTRAPASAAEV